MTINSLHSKNELEKNSTIIFILMMIGNICNYLYQIVMGNIMSIDDYGILNTLLSLFTVLCVPITVLQLVSARYTAQYEADHKSDQTARLFKYEFKICLASVLIIGILTFPISESLSELFHIAEKHYILAVCVLAALNSFLPVLSGTLQGLKRFVAFGLISVINPACKLIIGTVLVLIGLDIYGNILGLGTGILVSIVFAMFLLRSVWQTKAGILSSAEKSDYWHFCAKAFTVQILTALLMNGDILLIKAFIEDSYAVGIYSSAMVIGKISMYVSTAVIAAMFPMVAEKQALNDDTRSLLIKSMIYGGGIALLCSVGMNLFGRPIVSLMFGSRYSAAMDLLFPISCYIIPVTLINILMNYCTALGKTKLLSLSLSLGMASIVLLLSFFHSSIAQMMYIMGGVLMLILIVTTVIIPFGKGGERNE